MAAVLYHLVQEPVWNAAKAAGTLYKPPTYDQDGFVHLTVDPLHLIDAGNHFYKGITDAFLLLILDATKLTAEVKYESAAQVGDMAVASAEVISPHLYGFIDFSAVVKELPIERSADGTFLSIPGLL